MRQGQEEQARGCRAGKGARLTLYYINDMKRQVITAVRAPTGVRGPTLQ